MLTDMMRKEHQKEQVMTRQLPALVLLITASWFTPAVAQSIPQIEPPPLVRLTGVLQPLAEKGHNSLHTLTVSIQGQEKLLRITKVEKLTGRSPDGWRLVQSLFPPRVRLVGSADFLRLLQEPKLEGAPLVIEGRLYVGDRMLLVTAVAEAPRDPPVEKP